MKAVGYIRVSTAEQAIHGFSLEAQRELLERYASEHDMSLVKIYADEGISASKQLHRRKAILQLLDDAERNQFDVILFKDLSRWSRNPSQFYAVQDRLDKANVSWIAVEQPNLETVTASGKLIVGIHISVAAHESAQLGERIRFVNDSRVKDGGVLGGDKSLPLGYKVGEIDGKKRVVIDEDLREAVQHAFKVYTKLQSVGAMQRALQEYGIYRTSQAIRHMLKQTMFKGEYRGVKGYCEPLISEEMWNEVQRIRERRTYTPPASKEGFVFSGLIRCTCGRTMVGYTAKKWHYYRCKGHADGLCENKHIVSELKLEKFMMDNIDEAVSKYKVLIHKKKKKNPAPARAKLERLNELYIEGRIDRKKYDEKVAEINKEIADSTERSESVRNAFPNGWREYYLNAPKTARNAAWKAVVDHIQVNEDQSFTIQFHP